MSDTERCTFHKCPDCGQEKSANARITIAYGEAISRREVERVTDEWLDRGIIA